MPMINAIVPCAIICLLAFDWSSLCMLHDKQQTWYIAHVPDSSKCSHWSTGHAYVHAIHNQLMIMLIIVDL